MRISKKRTILFIALTTVIVLIALYIFFLNKNTQDNKQKSEKSISNSDSLAKKYNLKNSDTYGIAYQVTKNDGDAAGQKYLDEQLKSTTDSKTKSKIYIYKSNLITSQAGGDTELALEYAMKAESSYATDNTAIAIAIANEKLNNKSDAIKYYKLYLERMKKFLDSYKGDYKSTYERNYEKYKSHLTELEAVK